MTIQAKESKGSITSAKGVVKIDTLGLSTIAVQLSGTFTATVVFEGTIDGSTWNALPLIKLSTMEIASSASAAAHFAGSVAGLKSIRVRCSSFTEGTVAVSLVASIGTNTQTDRTDKTTGTANTPSIATAATALAANSARKGWMIQNVGTNPLFVRLGADASATVFHAVLKGGTGDNDGLGASMSQMSGVIYTGIITIAGTSPKYVVTEL